MRSTSDNLSIELVKAYYTTLMNQRAISVVMHNSGMNIEFNSRPLDMVVETILNNMFPGIVEAITDLCYDNKCYYHNVTCNSIEDLLIRL